jgi:threonine dehydratase
MLTLGRLQAPQQSGEFRALSPRRIASAVGLIDSVFRNSPQFEVRTLSAHLGCRLVVKIETLNPIRSFKARGAQFLVAQLPERSGLVCATSGNFGQGMAYAARKRDMQLTVFANESLNALKLESMRAMGADVRTVGHRPVDADQGAETFAAETGARLIEDGGEAAIAEGAGTIALEMLRWPEPFDDIVAPLGDGSLLAGIGCWVKSAGYGTRVVGVCANGSPAMERSLREGTVVMVPEPQTIADGLAIETPRARAIFDLAGTIDDVLMVEDAALVDAMRMAHRDLGVVLEPSGAAALAGVLSHRHRFEGRLVGVVLTGGNVTSQQMSSWLCC